MGGMTLRIGSARLSGIAIWSLFMAAMFVLLSIVQGTATNPTIPTAAGMLIVIAAYDTAVRWRNGGESPTGLRHTIAAAVLAGSLAVTLSTVAFLYPPFGA